MGISLLQPSFSAGEVSPSLSARVDIAKYSTALAICKNFTVMAQGGVRNRPGTKYVGSTISDLPARMIRFKFSIGDACVLIFSDLKMRVVRKGAYVLAPIVTNGKFRQNVSGWAAYVGAVTWDSSKAIGLSNTTTTTAQAGQALNNLIVGQTYSLTFTRSKPSAISIGTAQQGTDVLSNSGAAGTFTVSFVATAATLYLTITNDSTANTFSYWSAISISGAVGAAQPPYEIDSPFSQADLAQVDYTQSADIMTFVHTLYRPRELKRYGNDDWTFNEAAYLPGVATPTGVVATGAAGTGATQSWRYQVTAVYDDSNQLEESLPGTSGTTTVYGSTSQASITWNSVAGSTYYNIYKDNSGSGIYGFVGRSTTTSFTDNNIVATKTDTPPTGTDPFIGAGNYPGAVGYFQQRKVYGGTLNNPQASYFSRTGVFNNFGYSTPSKDDDAITWTMSSTEVNQILHYLPLRQLITLTSGAEWIIQGGSAGFTASNINGNAQSYNGSGYVPPLLLNDTAIYLQDRGRIVSSLNYSLEADGFSSDDLTIFSNHLFVNYAITDWTYQKSPDSIVWGVRSDGQMVGLTYLRKQEVVAWHRHETDGFIEKVCSIPEGSEDALYLIVRRTINGVVRRYIERMQSRIIPLIANSSAADVAQSYFVDCGLSYQGWNTGTSTMTLTGGTQWGYPEALTLTCSNANYFTAGDVGRQIHLRDSDTLAVVRLDITAFVNGSTISVTPSSLVPDGLRAVAVTDWAKALRTFAGLDHLEGKSVAILADGNTVGDFQSMLVISGGAVTIPNHAAVAHIGLPYTSDLQTMRINASSQETLFDKNKTVTSVSVIVEESRGIFAGSDEEHLFEFKQRYDEDYNSSVNPLTGVAKISIQNTWSGQGQVFIRQNDPLPLTVLGIIPEVTTGGKN